MVRSSTRLMNWIVRSIALRPLNIAWWFTQTTPTVRKLATYVTSCGHCPSSAENSLPDATSGTVNCSTSSVIATAKTPSLKASSRDVLTSTPSGEVAGALPGPGGWGESCVLCDY